MARIRSIKPGFFKNEELAELSPWHRLCFAGLWCQADREGRLEDRPKRLKAEVFPYDDVDMPHLLTDLVARGFMIRYEVLGVRYLAIPEESWQKHQRPRDDEARSILPPMSAGTVTSPQRQSDESVSQQCYRELGSGNGDLGSGNLYTSRTSARERFTRFWAVYPRKVGKDAAWRLWQRLKPDEALTAAILEIIATQTRSTEWRKDGGQFIPHPRTWLHQGRWQDEASLPPGSAPHWSENCQHQPPCERLPDHRLKLAKEAQGSAIERNT